MKRNSKTISAALVAALSVSFLVPAADFSPVGVDVVSAASEAWVAPAPAPKPAAKPAAKPAVRSTARTTYTGAMPTSFSRLLVEGSLGAEVRLLQTRLNAMGHNLRVDGIYGPLTKAAVMDYQQKNDLVVDGVVGVNTRAKLNAPAAETAPIPTEPTPLPTEPTPPPTPVVDAVTAASLEVTDPAVFEKSIGTDGKWIVAVTDDITTSNELVLEGTFTNGKTNEDGTEQIDRKIALYTQDENRVVLERFTLTAPKLTVKSPNARLQGGTFKTDVYIEAPNTKVIDAVVEGDIHFMNQEAMDTFVFEKGGRATGEVKMHTDTTVDAISAASLEANDPAVFAKSIGTDGKWIVAVTKDVTVPTPLVLEGTFTNGKTNEDGTEQIDRKIALYTQDENRVVLERFTLTAPKLTVKSPNARLQGGTFKTDVYVEGLNAKLVDAVVEGDIHFMSQEAMDTFVYEKGGRVTGEAKMHTDAQVDTVSAASLNVTDPAVFAKSIGTDGKWIVAVTKDVTVPTPLVLEGIFTNGKTNEDGTEQIDRKIALYTQDENRVVLERFTLTAPKLTVKSPNARLQGGTFKTDVYIESLNAQVIDAVIEGNLYFASQEAMDTFKFAKEGKVTGEMKLMN